mgnify:FL=1|tara:strand:- start:430 stop:645 length:216 start_codon:yes stop_codon:yes gene_type:complete
MKGPSIALILGGKPGEGGEESSYEEAFEDAARECLSAIEDGDSSRFADSLKDCIEICMEVHMGQDYKEDEH